MTSHSTTSKPGTSRGRSASVAGRVSSSLRQGIWMMSFMRNRRGAGARAGRPLGTGYGVRRRDHRLPCTYTGAPSQFRRMASATLTRPRPGQPEVPAAPPALGAMALARPRRAHARHDGRLLRLPDVSRTTTATTRCSGAASCCTGRCRASTATARRPSTRSPIAFGALLSLFGDDADRIMVGATLASFVVLAAGRLPPRRGRRSRRSWASSPRRCCARASTSRSSPRAAYIDIPYLALSCGRRRSRPAHRRRGTPVFVLLAAAGLLRPEAWLLSGLYFLWCFLPATWRAARSSTRRWPPSARSSGPRSTGSSPATRCSRCTHTSGLGRGARAHQRRCRRSRPRRSTFLRNLDKVPVFYAGILGLVLAIVLVAAARR